MKTLTDATACHSTVKSTAIWKLVLTFAVVFAFVSTTHAGLINVDYDADGQAHVGNNGIFSTGGTVWNGVNGNTALVDEFGAATSVSITGSTLGGTSTQPGVHELFTDTSFIDGGAGGGTRHNISGLVAGNQYDLVVYGDKRDQFHGSAVVVTHAGGNAAPGVFGPAFGSGILPGQEGVEYVIIAGMTPYDLGGGDFGLTITAGDSGAVFTTLAGFQLRGDFTANTVPEPSSMALLGLGITGTALIARRRKTARV